MAIPTPFRLPSALETALRSGHPEALDRAWSDLSVDRRPPPEALEQYVIEKGGSLSPVVAQWVVAQGTRLDQVGQAAGMGYFDWMSQAIQESNHDLVTWLAQQGLADRRLPSGGPTPLMEALLNEQWETADVLLAAGAKIDALTLHGQTALHQSAQGYHVQAMVWLMEHGADPTIEDSFQHLASELIPQDTGKEWRPDDTYAWLTTAEEATLDNRKVIPSEIKDEVLVEKIGLTFTAVPPQEWTAEQTRVSEVLVARGVLAPPQPPAPSRLPRVR